jgi:predicted phosphoribosyltransferase
MPAKKKYLTNEQRKEAKQIVNKRYYEAHKTQVIELNRKAYAAKKTKNTKQEDTGVEIIVDDS